VAALGIVANSHTTATQLQATFEGHFPKATTQSLAAVRAAFENAGSNGSGVAVENGVCEASVNATLDAAGTALDAFQTLERYIQLTIPTMEDGGNFGVSVQLAALKVITDTIDKIEKGVEELYKYPSARADALEKCKLPATSITKTSTVAASESAGTDAEKGDVKSTSKSQSTEEKSIESGTGTSAELALRKKAVLGVDVRFYAKAKATYQNVITGFLAVMDFMEKNKDKIGKPKGDGGARGYSHNMY
jgi:Proteasome activator pa28 beta subunit